MQNSVNILYGKNGFSLEIQEHWNPVVIEKPRMPRIKSIECSVKKMFKKPTNCKPLLQLSSEAQSACILVCDSTRPVPNNLFLPSLLKELLKGGMQKENIIILIATGLHRPATKEEIAHIISFDWVMENFLVENHFARNENDHRLVGVTSQGNEIKLDKRFLDSDLKIATGLVEPHFMAGFSGGRKVVTPGIAHVDTITRLHSASYLQNPLAINCNLEGNPLHQDQLEAIQMVGSVFAINCVLDDKRNLSFINFGEIISSHGEAVKFISSYSTVKTKDTFQTVVTGSAGYPLDSTYYQTVKAMVSPIDILSDGGDLIILSNCSEGLGSKEFRESQKHLVNMGINSFLKSILAKKHARIDEWQTAMMLNPLSKGNIYLYTDGLTKFEEAITGVNIIKDPTEYINKSIMKHNNNNIAIIPEGPYVVPIR